VNLSSLFMEAPAIIAVFRGPDHVFELVNPAYRRLIGDREVIGKPAREAVPEMQERGSLDRLDDAFTTGESVTGRELRLRFDRSGRGNPEDCFFNFIYQPMRGSDGRVEGVIVFAFDVTDEIRARQAAEQSAQAKDEFIAMVSHELRTPLTSILGWARMLRLRTLDPATTSEALEALERSAQAQVRLVEDLLDTARITSGKLRLDKRPVDLRMVVEAALADVAPAAAAKHIGIAHELSCDCRMLGDPMRLQQIVWNLLTNAIKFTPEGGSVTVRMNNEASVAVIEFHDTGLGIEAELLPRLFTRFRQGDPAAKDRKGGLGLGLSLARHLAELHGGTVEATSDGPGQGATFTVRLPLAESDAGEFLERTNGRSAKLPRLDGVRLLIVEDEADNREMFTTVARQCGAQVMSASTGQAALDLIQQWKPDVIVCDIALPDFDGCQLLERARQVTSHPMPALALTVFGNAVQEARVRAAGFDVFRQKPIEPADFAHEIARMVRGGNELRSFPGR
jgi:PAS domain S-box-containing protein